MVVRIDLEHGPQEFDQAVAVFSGELGVSNPRVESVKTRRSRDLARGVHHLAVFTQLRLDRHPHEGGIDGVLCPGGGDFIGRHAQQGDVLFGHAVHLQHAHQGVVGRGADRRRNALASEVGRFVDARAISCDQCLGGINDLAGSDHLIGQSGAQAGCQGRRADFRNLNAARGHGRIDFCAGSELSQLNLPAGGPLKASISDERLVGNRIAKVADQHLGLRHRLGDQGEGESRADDQ